jgi:hypothetical protein
LVLTKDQAIARRPNEIGALSLAGVRAFVLSAGEVTGPDQAALFVQFLPKIRKWLTKIRRGAFVIRVNKDGSSQVLYPSRHKHTRI